MEHQEGRFDRQLRLWGAHGQQYLERTLVLALSSHPVIAEALESLCASGLQQFCLVEGGSYETSHGGIPSSFILLVQDKENIETTDGSMNNNVKKKCRLQDGDVLRGRTLLQNLSKIANDGKNELRRFIPMKVSAFRHKVCEQTAFRNNLLACAEMIIVVGIHNSVDDMTATKSLRECLLQNDQKLVHELMLRTQGPYASIDFCVSPYLILDSRQDRYKVDLHLNPPFKALSQLSKSVVDAAKLQHSVDDPRARAIPYVLILTYLHNQFVQKEGRPPQMADLRDLQKVYLENLGKELLLDEECLIETKKNMFEICKAYQLPSGLSSLFDVAERLVLKQDREIAAILKRYIEREQRHPLTGSIPDMASESALYQKVRACYVKEGADQFDLLVEKEKPDGDCMELLKELKRGGGFCQIAVAGNVEQSPTQEISKLAERLEAMYVMEESRSVGCSAPCEGPLAELFEYETEQPRSTSLVIGWLAGIVRTLNKAKSVCEVYLEIISNLESLKGKRSEENWLKMREDLRHAKQIEGLLDHGTGSTDLPSSALIVGGILAGEITKLATRRFLPSDGTVIWE